LFIFVASNIVLLSCRSTDRCLLSGLAPSISLTSSEKTEEELSSKTDKEVHGDSSVCDYEPASITNNVVSQLPSGIYSMCVCETLLKKYNIHTRLYLYLPMMLALYLIYDCIMLYFDISYR
jgi:hypothetical protein